MKTAKALGFTKGDFIHTGLFPGIIVQNVNTATPMCEVWGIEHEMGSVYAQDLRKIAIEDFISLANISSNPPYTDVAKKALKSKEE